MSVLLELCFETVEDQSTLTGSKHKDGFKNQNKVKNWNIKKDIELKCHKFHIFTDERMLRDVTGHEYTSNKVQFNGYKMHAF